MTDLESASSFYHDSHRRLPTGRIVNGSYITVPVNILNMFYKVRSTPYLSPL